MRYVLHVGQTKAGSTSLQSFLQLNYERLLRDGVCYPGGERGPKQVQHSWVLGALERAPEKVEALLRTCRGSNVAIISGEVLVNIPADNLELFHQMLDREGADDIRVVLYVRNIADRLLSRSAQKAKHGNFLYPEFAKFMIRNRDTRLTLAERISTFETEFGADQVSVRLLEDAQPLERDLLDCAGVAWSDDYVLPPPANVSPDPIRSQVSTLIMDEFGWAAANLLDSGVTLPRIENAQLKRLELLVADIDLDHPKLEPFKERLTEIRWRDDALQPDPADYIEGLIATLTMLRNRAASRRAHGKTPLPQSDPAAQKQRQESRRRKREQLRHPPTAAAISEPES